MKTDIRTTKIKRNSFYKLLDSFEEKDFYAVKNFAEFIKTRNGKDTLKEILLNAEFDNEEINGKTIVEIEKARKEFEKGKTFSNEQIKKELGI